VESPKDTSFAIGHSRRNNVRGLGIMTRELKAIHVKNINHNNNNFIPHMWPDNYAVKKSVIATAYSSDSIFVTYVVYNEGIS